MARDDAATRGAPATRNGAARLVAAALVSIASASASSTPVTAGLELWLDASTLGTATTSVTTWADQSGNGRDATQSVPGSTPTYVASNPLFFDRPTVSFDGGDYLDSALASSMGITGSSARTIFFVFSQDAALSRNILGYGSNSGLALFDVAAAAQEISAHFHGTAFINGTQQFFLNTMTVGTAQFDTGVFKTFQHDAAFSGEASSTALALNTGDSAFRVGGGMYPTYNHFNGDIAELLVYSGTMSEANRIAVDTYLYSKYTTAAAAVLEPGTLALVGIALAGLGWGRRRA